MNPELLEIVTVGVVGILAGGVVNVLADDIPLGRAPRIPIYPDGSIRPVLAWLGVTAFLLKLRQSRKVGTTHCSAEYGEHHQITHRPKLGWRYPLAEMATAALALVLYFVKQDPDGEVAVSAWIWIAYAAFYVLIAVVDIERRRIPIPLLIPMVLLAIFDAAVLQGTGVNLNSAVLGGLTGFLIFHLVFAGGILFIAAIKRLFKRSLVSGAFGFGDVMLMGVVGLVVGFPNIVLAIFIALFAGALGAIAVVLAQFFSTGKYQAFASLPYAPYILAAAFIVQLFGDQLGALLPGA